MPEAQKRINRDRISMNSLDGIIETKLKIEVINGKNQRQIFEMPQMAKLHEAIRSMKDADGIIFDLRGNPGGVGDMSVWAKKRFMSRTK